MQNNNGIAIERLTYSLFILANILMLFNPGSFWDSWVYIHAKPENIYFQFDSSGAPIFGLLISFLVKFENSVFFHRSLTLVLQLLQIFFLFRILNIYFSKRNVSIFLSLAILVFAIFPYYDAKIIMVVFPYTLCLTLFVIATYFLFLYNAGRGGLVARISSLTLFFISFLTNSLLFFYLIPIFIIFFYDIWKEDFPFTKRSIFKNFKFSLVQIRHHLDFFILPFFFWIIKSIYFQQSFAYKEYNQLNLESLTKLPKRLIIFFYSFFVDLFPLIKDASQYLEIWIILVLSFFVLSYIFRKIQLNFTSSWYTVGCGFLIFLIGAFPYLLVGKNPIYQHYMSRHQLLIGFGMSLTIVAILFLIKSVLFKKLAFPFLLSIFITFNIFLQFSYFKGFVKQEVFINYFSNNNFSSKTSKTIILRDHTYYFTERGNPVKFYEFTGILKSLNEKENILLIREKDWNAYNENGLMKTIEPRFEQYSLSDYQIVEPTEKLRVTYNKPLPLFTITSFYWDYFSGNKENWNNYFKFELKPLEEY